MGREESLLIPKKVLIFFEKCSNLLSTEAEKEQILFAVSKRY